MRNGTSHLIIKRKLRRLNGLLSLAQLLSDYVVVFRFIVRFARHVTRSAEFHGEHLLA